MTVATVAAVTPVDVTQHERLTAKKQAPFSRARMEQALQSGPAVRIPHGLSREEMRQFILNASK
jgi:hypothetical protein